jgi:hypothetical protein
MSTPIKPSKSWLSLGHEQQNANEGRLTADNARTDSKVMAGMNPEAIDWRAPSPMVITGARF